MNLLGTRMDTDGHGFYHADVYVFEHESLEYNEFTMRMGIFFEHE